MSGPNEILRLTIVSEQDVFLARQRGREVAAATGLENQDQVRIATAVSELGRELVAVGAPATIALSVLGPAEHAMVIEASWPGRLASTRDERELAAVEGIAAAARMCDHCCVHWAEEGGRVTLRKQLPLSVVPPTPERVAEIKQAVLRTRPGNALDALREQNQDLLATLGALRARQEDLLRVNTELEETNRGVLALHAELSDELEQTNRGVVALYAELDEASTRLREASESKTRFWANVSHELRTPLNSVLGLSRLLLDPGSAPLTSEQRYQVELIKDAGQVLLALVNELLDVAKAESGQIRTEPQVVDVGTVLGELHAAMRPILTNPEVALVVEQPQGAARVRTDPVLLARILRNLVSNALKFTEAGEVRCRAVEVPHTGWLEITVCDTGIGIPAEHHQRVFEEFYQVPGPAQTRTGGSGLGLPYARKVTEMLGGRLDLESSPGVGTTIVVRLPLDAAPDDSVPRRLGNVLVVDDDPAFRELVRGLIGRHSALVTEAEDGASALRALRADPAQLVLLDLNMPPPNGAEVVAEMRRDAALRSVPVVVVTSAHSPAQLASLRSAAVVLDKAGLTLETLLAAAAAATRQIGAAR